MRNWLKNKRLEKRLTQEELAIKIKIDKTSIGKYELGLRKPNVVIAKAIARELEFDWTLFYSDT
ncbi:MAG TPA: helix-turn-helix transcriptional regulator [Clostridia bacterium]